MNSDLKDFRNIIDSDTGFQSKRRLLITVCTIFLALNLSGATIEEANTFIFKLNFTNYLGLSYLFITSIMFLTLRYYSYAQNYHSRLYDFWSQRLISDNKVFYYDAHDDEFSGLLSKAVVNLRGDDPNINEPIYCISGLFKRSISYKSNGFDEERGPYGFTAYIELYKFTDTWKLKNYLRLLTVELQYQIESLFKFRENLDLLAPYLLSLVSVLSFIFKTEILSWLPTA